MVGAADDGLNGLGHNILDRVGVQAVVDSGNLLRPFREILEYLLPAEEIVLCFVIFCILRSLQCADEIDVLSKLVCKLFARCKGFAQKILVSACVADALDDVPAAAADGGVVDGIFIFAEARNRGDGPICRSGLPP